MSTLVDFTPSLTQVFSFLATLANGAQYNVACPWNEFGQRWYVTVSDLSNNVILHRAIAQSGPTFNATLTWKDDVATCVLSAPHNVPVAQVANARVYDSGTPFDGLYTMLSVDAETLTFQLPTNPVESVPVSGKVDFPLDLLAGYGIGSLYFHSDIQCFEF